MLTFAKKEDKKKKKEKKKCKTFLDGQLINQNLPRSLDQL